MCIHHFYNQPKHDLPILPLDKPVTIFFAFSNVELESLTILSTSPNPTAFFIYSSRLLKLVTLSNNPITWSCFSFICGANFSSPSDKTFWRRQTGIWSNNGREGFFSFIYLWTSVFFSSKILKTLFYWSLILPSLAAFKLLIFYWKLSKPKICS